MKPWSDRPTTRLVRPGDTSFWQGVWQDPVLTAERESCPAARQVMAEAERRLWWWVVPEGRDEWAHFPAWFGQVLMPTPGRAPTVADLGLWHDLVHLVTLPTGIAETFVEWRDRMRVNEILVSLETEVMVYDRWPTLRARTFSQPIWADGWDRSLFDADWMDEEREQRWWEEACRAGPAMGLPQGWTMGDFQRLWWARRRAARFPREGHVEDQRIAHYERSAMRFYGAWQADWQRAEADRHHDAVGVKQGEVERVIDDQKVRWMLDGGFPFPKVWQSLVTAGTR